MSEDFDKQKFQDEVGRELQRALTQQTRHIHASDTFHVIDEQQLESAIAAYDSIEALDKSLPIEEAKRILARKEIHDILCPALQHIKPALPLIDIITDALASHELVPRDTKIYAAVFVVLINTGIDNYCKDTK
jgi:uridine kinase